MVRQQTWEKKERMGSKPSKPPKKKS
jgi:hypothetical protein